MKQIVITFGLAILLFISGIYTYSSFILLTIPKANTYMWNSFGMDIHFRKTLVYSIGLCLLPILCFLLSNVCKLKETKDILKVGLTILISCVIAIVLRYLWLKYVFGELSEYVYDNTVSVFALEHLKMEVYFIYGELIGAIVSFFIFRKKVLVKIQRGRKAGGFRL